MGPSLCTPWLVIWSLEALGYWLVCIVVPPMGLQNPLTPLVLSLVPLRTLCSVKWLADSIHLCICQTLVESLRRQLYQASVSKHLLASTIMSGFGDCIWDESQVGQSLDGHLFSLCSTVCLCNFYHGYFVPPSKKDRSIHTLVFVLLEFHMFCDFILGILSF